MDGFFDLYPEFYKTSPFAYPNRLKHRFTALIQNNLSIIRDQSILDIASHDGRWSFAAIKSGARHTLGIEARSVPLENARTTFRMYQVPENQYRFIHGDVHQEVLNIARDSIDTVFCFGFLYHTIHHFSLLSNIDKLRPKHVILDTEVTPSDRAVIQLRHDSADNPKDAVSDSCSAVQGKVLVGAPSRLAVEWMLTNLGYSFRYFDWHMQGITNWENLQEYKEKRRLTLVAKNNKF